MESLNNQMYQNCLNSNSTVNMSSARSGYEMPTSHLLRDCEAERQSRTQTNQNQRSSCLASNSSALYEYQMLLSCIHPESERLSKMNASCNSMIQNSQYDSIKSSCVCKEGFLFSKNQCITKEQEVINYDRACKVIDPNLYHDPITDNCLCAQGFVKIGSTCTVNKPTIVKEKPEVVEKVNQLKQGKNIEDKATKLLAREVKKEADINSIVTWISTTTDLNPTEKESLPSRIGNFFKNTLLKFKFW